MSKEYSNEQNQVFIENIEEYRSLIDGESPKETERITKQYAKILMKSILLLSDRNIEGDGVAQRLVYFDNLLAGVEFPYQYYLDGTYEKYFGKMPRRNGSKNPNKWNTIHQKSREKKYRQNIRPN
ncbi:hypothetical protein [Peribacillus frigoritolerans]|uniref:hypothetical protein n=1 Tax=Peribacillus frigoritolerans TaxID=450367 RepID=UPI00105A5F4D|nr:hypothetical protein [Peribacillus frigoritolerans]TDL76153.1 hypothetical protein E2R53_20885 [Peribacillus frigoritolerans]